MEGMDILNMSIDSVEFIERPPMERGKIIEIEVGTSNYGDREAQTLTLYILDKDSEFIRRQTVKVSNRKPSKFYKFVEALKECGYNGTIGGLKGHIFRWEFREVDVGNFKTSLWLPVEHLGQEPVTFEEEEAVKEYKQNLASLRNNNDDLIQIR